MRLNNLHTYIRSQLVSLDFSLT